MNTALMFHFPRCYSTPAIDFWRLPHLHRQSHPKIAGSKRQRVSCLPVGTGQASLAEETGKSGRNRLYTGVSLCEALLSESRCRGSLGSKRLRPPEWRGPGLNPGK